MLGNVNNCITIDDIYYLQNTQIVVYLIGYAGSAMWIMYAWLTRLHFQYALVVELKRISIAWNGILYLVELYTNWCEFCDIVSFLCGPCISASHFMFVHKRILWNYWSAISPHWSIAFVYRNSRWQCMEITLCKWNATNYMIHVQLFALQSYRCDLHLPENVSINLAAIFILFPFLLLSTFIYRFRISSDQFKNVIDEWWEKILANDVSHRISLSLNSSALGLHWAIQCFSFLLLFLHPFLIFMLILKFCVNTMRFLLPLLLQNACGILCSENE